MVKKAGQGWGLQQEAYIAQYGGYLIFGGAYCSAGGAI